MGARGAIGTARREHERRHRGERCEPTDEHGEDVGPVLLEVQVLHIETLADGVGPLEERVLDGQPTVHLGESRHTGPGCMTELVEDERHTPELTVAPTDANAAVAKIEQLGVRRDRQRAPQRLHGGSTHLGEQPIGDAAHPVVEIDSAYQRTADELQQQADDLGDLPRAVVETGPRSCRNLLEHGPGPADAVVDDGSEAAGDVCVEGSDGGDHGFESV